MVILEFRRLTREGAGHAFGFHPAARLAVNGQDVRLERIEDCELELPEQAVNLRTGEMTAATEDAEEWARSLAAMFRGPYLWAEVLEDSNPLPDVDVEAVELEDPAFDSTPALH